MNITKFGHSCLLLEKDNTRILIDPGLWSENFTDLENIDAIFISHEHADHCSIELLQKVLVKNPQAKVFTNNGVGRELGKVSIAYKIFEEGSVEEIKDIRIEAIGREHAVIYRQSPCANTGFIFDDRFYHPGDSFIIPQKDIEVLALPIVGPWLKTSESLDFAFTIKPGKAFPIHDGMVKDGFVGFSRHPGIYLSEQNIEFFVPEIKKSFEI